MNANGIFQGIINNKKNGHTINESNIRQHIPCVMMQKYSLTLNWMKTWNGWYICVYKWLWFYAHYSKFGPLSFHFIHYRACFIIYSGSIEIQKSFPLYVWKGISLRNGIQKPRYSKEFHVTFDMYICSNTLFNLKYISFGLSA